MPRPVSTTRQLLPLRPRLRITRFRGLSSGNHVTYCWDLLRNADYENYCVARLAPSSLQPALTAIRAFNVETAAIKDAVSGNSEMGRIRMHFWRETIKEIFAGTAAPKDPVGMALAAAISRHSLSEEHFMRVLDARDRDLAIREQPESLKGVEDYADQTQGSLLYLYMEMLMLEDAERIKTQRLLQNFGRAIGIALGLRALPYLVPRKMTTIPFDVAAKHSLYTKTLLEGPKDEKEAEALAGATYDVARLAHGYLDEGIELAKELAIPLQVQRTLFLPVLGTKEYLDALAKNKFDAYKPDLFDPRSLTFVMKLWRASFFGPF